MILRVVREPSVDGSTLSVWFTDGHFECFGLEDQIRERAGQPVATWKVNGETAIPSGRYRVIVTESVRFRRRLPLLVDVPGFTGVRIHPGNSAGDSSGCLLPGYDKFETSVGRSRLAFEQLFDAMNRAIARGETITIQIDNPPYEGGA